MELSQILSTGPQNPAVGDPAAIHSAPASVENDDSVLSESVAPSSENTADCMVVDKNEEDKKDDASNLSEGDDLRVSPQNYIRKLQLTS